MELRPLGFGEIFDRAITLYIRNFLPFAAIVGVMIVPLAILEYIYDVANQPQMDAILRVFTHLGNAQAEQVPPSAFNSPGALATLLLMLFVTYAIWPFALNAVAIGVARLYRDRPVEFRACYEAVLRRWLAIVGIIAMDLLIVLGWYVVVFIVVMIFVGVLSYFAAAAAGAVAFGLLGVIVLFALLASLAPLMISLTFAMYSTVIEERPVMQSIGLGFSRVFNRAEFWRSVLFAMAIFAVMLGASAIFSFVALVAAFAHLPLLEVAIDSISRAAVAPFAVVLLAIYYFDVRIRREAFDVESGLDRLAAVQPA
jgi:hypothetical protein